MPPPYDLLWNFRPPIVFANLQAIAYRSDNPILDCHPCTSKCRKWQTYLGLPLTLFLMRVKSDGLIMLTPIKLTLEKPRPRPTRTNGRWSGLNPYRTGKTPASSRQPRRWECLGLCVCSWITPWFVFLSTTTPATIWQTGVACHRVKWRSSLMRVLLIRWCISCWHLFELMPAEAGGFD